LPLHYISILPSSSPLFYTVFSGFHYSVFTHTRSIFWSFSFPIPSLLIPPSSCPRFTLMPHCHHHHHHLRSRFHKWARPWNIWLFELGLLHSTWWSSVPSIFNKWHNSIFSLWQTNIPWDIYIAFFLYPFISYEHLCWFHSLAVLNIASVNMNMQVSVLWIDFSLHIYAQEWYNRIIR
jgi:hypothetical protein